MKLLGLSISVVVTLPSISLANHNQLHAPYTMTPLVTLDPKPSSLLKGLEPRGDRCRQVLFGHPLAQTNGIPIAQYGSIIYGGTTGNACNVTHFKLFWWLAYYRDEWTTYRFFSWGCMQTDLLIAPHYLKTKIRWVSFFLNHSCLTARSELKWPRVLLDCLHERKYNIIDRIGSIQRFSNVASFISHNKLLYVTVRYKRKFACQW